MRPSFQWKLRRQTLVLGQRTLVMGIVNVTPDSFSDGGQFLSRHQAVEHAIRLLEECADIIDLGGESTRPGKREPVSEALELDRVIPVIEEICGEHPEAVLSIDTYKSAVARAAIRAGAQIVNDVSAFRWDPSMASAVAELKCGVVLMHMRGRPEEWHQLPPISGDELVGLVKRELGECAAFAASSGIARESLVLDPGFGFGKRFDENYPLLARLDELQQLGLPLLAGTSRKSFIGRTLTNNGHLGNMENREVDMKDRLYGTLATVTAAVLRGAHIVRVHDVKAAVDAVRVADAILNAEKTPSA